MRRIVNTIEKVDENALQSSFIESVKDTEFASYINSLGIPPEVLMKYTSSLEDFLKEKKNCTKCKSLSVCPNMVKGYAYTPEFIGKKILFSYVACYRYNKHLEETNYLKNIDFFKLPKELKEASFQDIYKDDKARIPIVKYFKEFMENYQKGKSPKGLYLTGSFGSGKTYLIAALFNEMAKRGVRSALIYYPELLRSLKSSFSSDYEERFRYIKRVPLLLLDDIGAENVTAWSRDEVLGPILQYRMEEGLSTFFTSNLNLEELESNFIIKSSSLEKVKARRIMERIKQLTISLSLISENRRNRS